MSNIQIPSFNLNADALDIKNDKELEEAIAKEGRRFEPGNVTLKITKPRFHINKETQVATCAKDPTWFNVAVTLEAADGRTKDYFIQVPTSKVKYGEKGTLFVFKKFMEFMGGIGESVTMQNLGKLVPKYFASEEAMAKNLTGKTLNVDMGYDGPHAEKCDDDTYKLVLKSGDYSEDGEVVKLPDIASMKVFAESKGVKLSFVEILKINSAVKAVKTEGWE